ncbi:MAG: VanZ family protein [Pseudomonadota bacterium]
MDPRASNARLLFWLLLLGYILFILSASFYSADWQRLEALDPNKNGHGLWFGEELSFRRLRDIATNVLLYMPLGLFTAVVVSLGRKIRITNPAIAAGLALSIAIETVQAFVGRFSDPTDIVSNSLGHVLGYVVMMISVNRFHLSPPVLLGLSSDQNGANQLQTLQGLRFLYIAIFYIVALLPLDFAVGLTNIFRKLQPEAGGDPRLILDLLYHWKQPGFPIRFLTLTVLAYVPVALLTSLIDQGRGVFSLSRTVLPCVGLALATEISQIFVASGRSDVLVIPLAAATGLAVGLAVRAARKNYRAQTDARGLSRFLILLIVCYLLFLFSLAWAPYEFESPGTWKRKLLSETNLIPFRLHFSSRSVAAAIDIVRELAILVPLGALIAHWMQTVIGCQRWLVRAAAGGILGLGVGLAIEGSQSLVVGRYIDVTDALLAAAGCMLGCVVWSSFAPRVSSSPSIARTK